MKKRNIIIALLVLVSCLLFATSGFYLYQMSPVGNTKNVIEVEIPHGIGVKDIASILKEKKLIHNDTFFTIYVRFISKGSIKASTYEFSQDMGLEEIVKILTKGNTFNKDAVSITFKEGLNIRQLGEIVASKTSITYDDWMKKMTDRDYVAGLIPDYWFLTDEILNKDIYYPLEGYLYPETYELKSKDVSVDDIVKMMLRQTDTIISKYKTDIDKSSFSVHELMTLASVVELEGVGDDRAGIAGVFYNRLADKWSLGSDVTACYAFKIEIKECNDNVPYSTYNPYNTRSSKMAGKLPVGPICNPSEHSLKGTFEPEEHQYYYFVADKFKKVFFTKNEKEHLAIIKEIKARGEWPW